MIGAGGGGIDRSGLEILGPDECLRRLQEGGVGCIGLPGSESPALRPVNFALYEGMIVVRTGDGRLLKSARRCDPAAFALHGIDRLEHTGWSVVVTGRISEREVDDASCSLALRPWAGGRKDRFVAISLRSVSGRRIPPGGPRS